MSASRNTPTIGVNLPYRYEQSLSRCTTCQDVCVQQLHAAKRLPFKCISEDLLPSYCYVTKANSKQFAPKFRNLPLHSAGKEEDLVNCKRIAACYQNSEPDTCAV